MSRSLGTMHSVIKSSGFFDQHMSHELVDAFDSESLDIYFVTRRRAGGSYALWRLSEMRRGFQGNNPVAIIASDTDRVDDLLAVAQELASFHM